MASPTDNIGKPETSPKMHSTGVADSQTERAASRLLSLPGELLDQILELAVTPDEFIAINLSVNGKALPRLVHVRPNVKESFYETTIPVPVFLINRSLGRRAQELFYSQLLLDLTYQCSEDNSERTASPLKRLGRIPKSLIRYVRLRAYSNVYEREMPFCEWQHIMSILSRHFPGLRLLELQAPSDVHGHLMKYERNFFLNSCMPQTAWVRTLYGLNKNATVRLLYSDKDYYEPDTEVLDPRLVAFNEWLPATSNRQPLETQTVTAAKPRKRSFDELQVPLQKLILRYAVLPEKHDFVHPTLQPHTVETHTAFSLLLTCRSVSKLTEGILYGEAVFASCTKKHEKSFRAFVQSRPPHQLAQMKRFYACGLDHWVDRRFDKWRLKNAPHLMDLERSIHMVELRHPCYEGDNYDSTPARWPTKEEWENLRF